MFSREETAIMVHKNLRIFVQVTSVVLLALALAAVPSAAADHGETGGHVVGDEVIDTPVEEHQAHDEQHGGPGGHLPASSPR